MNTSLRSVAVNLAIAVLVTVFGLVATGCGSSSNQPSINATPSSGY